VPSFPKVRDIQHFQAWSSETKAIYTKIFLEDKYLSIYLPSQSTHHTTLIQQRQTFVDFSLKLACYRDVAGHNPGPRHIAALAYFHQFNFLARGKSQRSPYCHLDCRRVKRCTPNYSKHFKQSLAICSRFLTANDMIGSFSSLVFCHIQEINTYMNHL